MSRTSRLKLGVFASTSAVNDWPGPTASWVRRTRLPVTTMSPLPLDRVNFRLVLPCRLVVTSLTVCPSKPVAVAAMV